jgi:tripartite-type tricarboxylate transporter receptor subunit TctC
MRTRLADLGCDIFTGSPADFARFIETETRKWAEVIKYTGVTAD